ncbi:retbindin [Discoglossus pictus]
MSPLLLSLLSSFLLFSPSHGSQDSCPFGKKQSSSREPEVRQCQQYSAKSCCSLGRTFLQSGRPFPWDVCGPMSARCEDYVRRVQCMYLCSIQISEWRHRGSATGIRELPLCQRYCDQWYGACKDDLICTGIAKGDKNCTMGCATYEEAFGSGRQLCEKIWGRSFIAVPKHCTCINPQGEGGKPPKETTLEEPDNQEGPSGYQSLCPKRPSATSSRRKGSRTLVKRNIFVEEIEGSGSGF